MKHTQLIGHGLAEADAYTGPSREVTVVTDTGELRSHDGLTPGGRTIPTEDQIVGFNFRMWNGAATYGAPGQILDADQGKILTFALAGTYYLPALANILNVGTPVWLYASVAGVIVSRKAATADLILDKGVDQTVLNLAQYETILIGKLTAARYQVTMRY